jgi:hypothetical protein
VPDRVRGVILMVLTAAAVSLTSCANTRSTSSLEVVPATHDTAESEHESSAVGTAGITEAPTPTTNAATTTTAVVTTTTTATAVVATTTATPTTPAVPTVTSTGTSTGTSTLTPYVIPVTNADGAGWASTHAAYPATDIFDNGCGGGVVSPVNGTLLEVRRVDRHDPASDNPATRGGRSVSILGDDGVRYYLAHLEVIFDSLAPGGTVDAGQQLGTIGTTGRSSACHVHFGISPPCPDREWGVRRGVVWPHRYLDDWRNGGQLSPVAEVEAFVVNQPDACAEAAADPFSVDA